MTGRLFEFLPASLSKDRRVGRNNNEDNPGLDVIVVVAVRMGKEGVVLVIGEGCCEIGSTAERLCVSILMFRIGTLFGFWALRIAKINYYVFRMYCRNGIVLYISSSSITQTTSNTLPFTYPTLLTSLFSPSERFEPPTKPQRP